MSSSNRIFFFISVWLRCSRLLYIDYGHKVDIVGIPSINNLIKNTTTAIGNLVITTIRHDISLLYTLEIVLIKFETNFMSLIELQIDLCEKEPQTVRVGERERQRELRTRWHRVWMRKMMWTRCFVVGCIFLGVQRAWDQPNRFILISNKAMPVNVMFHKCDSKHVCLIRFKILKLSICAAAPFELCSTFHCVSRAYRI